MKPRVLFYVQHLLGVGHFARASHICRTLAENGAKVRLVTGGPPVSHLFPDKVEVVQLPVLKADSARFSHLVDKNDKIVSEQFLNDRRDILLSSFEEFNPDCLVIEAFPFGRRMLRFELLPLLEKAKSQAHPPWIIASVRDILQQNRKQNRLDETVETLQKYFDQILVHADPDFADLAETFPPYDKIAQMVTNTGIVGGPLMSLKGRSFDIVVSVGGGTTGGKLLATALKTAAISRFSDLDWCILTGPEYYEEARCKVERIRTKNISLFAHKTDFTALLNHARLSISQAGYNTIADILKAGCPAIIVPFADHGETEQLTRSNKLKTRKRAVVLESGDLTVQHLAEKIEKALQPTSPGNGFPQLDLSGAQTSTDIIIASCKANMARQFY